MKRSGGGKQAQPHTARRQAPAGASQGHAHRVRIVQPKEPGTGSLILGAIAGALAGFVTYWSGAALAATQDLLAMPNQQVPQEFLRPFHTFTYWELVVVAAGMVIGALVSRYRWSKAGLLAYVGLVTLIAGYVVSAVTVSIPQVPPDERWLSYLLLAAEASGLSLIVIFSFYTLDAGSRREWRRNSTQVPYDPKLRPKVAFQVPVFNEDPEMVKQTILHLVRQDYPKDRFTVVVCDDSTDTRVRDQLAAYCKKVGAIHMTRVQRNGFKAGALNEATRRLPRDIELISVIDADYWVAPDYLRSIVGYFTNPRMGFVQTPQDYRNVEESFLTRRYKAAEAYFYHAIMPSRNEENAIIFCGTMGMIRRTALEQVGGFAEDQICEDAEISVRLAAHLWHSLYVDQSFGKGLVPAVFEAYKKQFHRWAFGNVRILFTHTGTIMRSRMTLRQKFDFMVSNLHWFDGYIVIGIGIGLLYLGLGPVLGYEAITHHQREPSLVALIPAILLIDGVTRLHLVLGRARNASFGESLMVLGMWFAIKMTNLVAVTKALMGFKTPFVRTPKTPESRLSPVGALFHAVRLTKFETLMGISLVSVAVVNALPRYSTQSGFGIILLPAWLVLYALFFLCAPIYAYLSYRTLSPTDFQETSASNRTTFTTTLKARTS